MTDKPNLMEAFSAVFLVTFGARAIEVAEGQRPPWPDRRGRQAHRAQDGRFRSPLSDLLGSRSRLGADHNWGGSGMIGLQEMLMQTPGDSIHLFPAWPREWDVDFRLHAPYGTRVDATLRAGRLVALSVEPPAAQSRIVLPPWALGLSLAKTQNRSLRATWRPPILGRLFILRLEDQRASAPSGNAGNQIARARATPTSESAEP